MSAKALKEEGLSFRAKISFAGSITDEASFHQCKGRKKIRISDLSISET